MAIQVGGTTVINNSRVLSNVTGLKTINSTSILGSGNIEAGASTTAGAVGTYAAATYFGNPPPGDPDYDRILFGATMAGSKLYPSSFGGQNYGGALTGTWRIMGYLRPGFGGDNKHTLFVRIS